MKFLPFVLVSGVLAASTFAAVEEAVDHRYKPFAPDAFVGDWQGEHYVAQVIRHEDGKYDANVFHAFDLSNDHPVASLHGNADASGKLMLSGEGWTGTINDRHFTAAKGSDQFDLHFIARTPPTLGAKPPAGATVLFDGSSMAAFANKKGKDWLSENGPASWKIVAGNLEVVPDTGGGIISHEKFGDCTVHVEFRTLGAPTNTGVYLETRYEVNINETYGELSGTPNGGLDNCTNVKPAIRASLPPLQWQTLDIEFIAPKFDASGKKTESAFATVYLNGVKLYEHQALNLPKGAAGRLGEAATGPIMLQEHGMPAQFRNVWVVRK